MKSLATRQSNRQHRSVVLNHDKIALKWTGGIVRCLQWKDVSKCKLDEYIN